MKQKTLTLIIASIFLIGILGMVGADREITDVSDEIAISNFIAGDTAQASFNYDYIAGVADNVDNSPFILRFNVSSQNQDYPVWKNDFSINGKIKRYRLFGLFLKEIPFSCSEDSPLTINHPVGKITLDVLNGTFYCYNPEGDLELDRHDEIYLDITSNPALWPGQYDLTAEMFYLPDIYPPFVNIINKDDFGKYYRELSNIEVQAEINDMNLKSYWGTIFLDNQTISLEFSHETGGIYYFTKILPIDIAEKDYSLKVFAEDVDGNIGEDNTILMIDRTGPVITAIQPTGDIYEEIIPIELEVTDVKAGVNTESVYYRLREMNGTSICPESGIGTWDCYNSGWINIQLNITTGTYQTKINTTEIGLESGEYWFEAKAKDLLENEGILE